MRQPGRADPPRAQVLVAVEPRAALGLRVVQVDHDQPIEPDPGVEVGQERVDGVRVGEIDAGRPGMRRVEAEPDRASAIPCAATASAIAASSVTSVPSPNPLPAEFSSTTMGVSGPAIDLGEREPEPIREPLRRRPRRRRRGATRCGR